MTEVIWTEKARKQLKNLDNALAKRILKKTRKLEKNESAYLDIRKIKGKQNYFRIRIGDYRVILKTNKGKNELEIIKVGHRKSIYD